MDFQTPLNVCKYMASLIPEGVVTVLEPTSGEGNLLSVLQAYQVTAPKNFFEMVKSNYDCAVLNPPFSDKQVFGAPHNLKGMNVAYHILYECMKMSDSVIALMPWLTLINSDKRAAYIENWGLKSVTSLPRNTFKGARIQSVILELSKGYSGKTEYRTFKHQP